MQDLTPDEARAHVIPALRAKRYNALARHISRALAAEPAFTPEQVEALAAMLRVDL